MLSNNNYWGHHLWKLKHLISFEYPIINNSNERNAIKNFIYSLQYILPCQYCKMHFEYILQLHPLTDDILKVKIKFIIWLVELHNIVNVSLHKPEISFENAIISLFNDEPTIYTHTHPISEISTMQQKNEQSMAELLTKYYKTDNSNIYDIETIDATVSDIFEKHEIEMQKQLLLEQEVSNNNIEHKTGIERKPERKQLYRNAILTNLFKNANHSFAPIKSIDVNLLIDLFKQQINLTTDLSKHKELIHFLDHVVEAIVHPVFIEQMDD